MPVLFRDYETRSTADLRCTGAWCYAASSSTEILCVAYAVDDANVQIWTPGQPIPAAFIAAANDPDWLIVAHNDQFESAIETRLLLPRYRWPLVPIERHRCTMAMCLAGALPGSLDGAASVLGLPTQKDAEGHRLMLQMAKPRKTRKGENPDLIFWNDSHEQRQRLAEYCQRDVVVEREIYRRVPALSADEQKLWALDSVVNARGFHIDLDLAEAARAIALAEQKAINIEIAGLTGGAVTGINQVSKLIGLLRARGHQVSGLTKTSVSALLAHHLDEDIRRVLELRKEGSRAAPRKLDSLIGGADSDRRMRGTLRYHGASTGRWSGSRFQPQNLKKPQSKDLDSAIAAVLAGDLPRVRDLGPPLSIVGDLSRSMICAEPGYLLIGADFSAIESRVLAWLAGETWKLGSYVKFDQTGDAVLEPYCQTASRILRRQVTPDDESGRAIGKVCDLAFGFGGGLGAYRRFDSSATHSDGEVEHFKASWRTAHAATVRFWHALERSLQRAIRTGQRVELKNLACEVTAGTLYLTLPSGRRLAYPEARLVLGKFGNLDIAFKDNAHGKWSEIRGWSGIFVENVVSAVSRDLLATAMLRLEAAGFPIVLHVHDEAVAEVTEAAANLPRFLELMTALPDWAAGLPVVAKGWAGLRYAKSAPRKAALAPGELAADDDEEIDAAVGGPAALPHEEVEPVPPVYAPSIKTLEHAPHVSLVDLVAESAVDGKIGCPFHDDSSPSLQLYADHFHCYGCGAHGSAIDWLIMVEGLDRDAAVLILEHGSYSPTSRPSCSRIEKTQADRDAKRRRALQIWRQAKPIAGTLAERYLIERRGIDLAALPDVTASLRFHPHCPFGPATRHPCLIALRRDVVSDEPVAIHRIALSPDGQKIDRRMLGGGGVVKLYPASDRLVVGEGIETTLAAATRISRWGSLLQPAWSATSSGMLANLPPVPGVERLIILVDHDVNGAGQAAALRCAETWSRAGRIVVRLTPKRQGTDFNDLVLEMAS